MNSNPDDADDHELAATRTGWAEDRTLLANERTFAGWMRTGMACVALALGMKAVFGAFEPTWVAKIGASIFIGVALFIFWSAQQRSCEAHRRFTENDVAAQPTSRMTFTAAVLAVGAVITGIILWML
ncbi:YidH family protein [Litoreibacter albidus]|uniref:Putative membrane protein n=1 Tax=Litoreibacter albidus TaxID=670155 RepID=A0A1H3C8C1_9RHOB|nr:DUF202 domain-containing protein [Litoreibacter albidus]SDX50361.1 putative membrane protein [Litoreibacter albidus]